MFVNSHVYLLGVYLKLILDMEKLIDQRQIRKKIMLNIKI